jgi:hypothetical protein
MDTPVDTCVGADTIGIGDEIEILRHAGCDVRDRCDPAGKMKPDTKTDRPLSA